jgi:hypothetical protein
LGKASDAGFDVFAINGQNFWWSQPKLKLFEDIESQRQEGFGWWNGILEIDVLEECEYFGCMLCCYDLVGDKFIQTIE